MAACAHAGVGLFRGGTMSDWIAERRRRFEAKADMGDMLPMLGRFLVEEPAVLEILGGARELERRWDALCDCVNEFEPEDMMACNERRDDLDGAILGVLRALETGRRVIPAAGG
jgi:hypothetical protein